MTASIEEPTKQPEEKDLDGKLEKLRKKLSFLHWGRIRFIGSLRIVSLIPFIGAGIIAVLSLPQFASLNVKKLIEDAWTACALTAFLLFLYSAHLIYHIFCPPMIKKFESLAELYKEQLSIKKAQMETYHSDDNKFRADLDHITETYAAHLIKHTFARWSAVSLFILSLICLFFFLFKFRALLIDP